MKWNNSNGAHMFQAVAAFLGFRLMVAQKLKIFLCQKLGLKPTIEWNAVRFAWRRQGICIPKPVQAYNIYDSNFA